MVPHSPFPELIRPPPRPNREFELYSRLEHGGGGAWVALGARRRLKRRALVRAAAVLTRLFTRP